MSSFAVLLLCGQACLIQNVFGACLGAGPCGADGFGPLGYGGAYGYGAGIACDTGIGYGAGAGCAAGIGDITPLYNAGFYGAYIGAFGAGFGYGLGGIAAPYEAGCGAAYEGAGVGNCAVTGELPVGGATAVAGQIPIIGAVEYAGKVYAVGAVTIAGNCACGCDCGGPYVY